MCEIFLEVDTILVSLHAAWEDNNIIKNKLRI